MTTTTLTPDELQNYLTIARDQRARALSKFETTYGKNSVVANAVREEIVKIETAIREAMTGQTDLSKNKPK